jgi:hypothetical protein
MTATLAGTIVAQVDPYAIARLILPACLSFAAQRALAGNADLEAHAAALTALAKQAAAPTAQG